MLCTQQTLVKIYIYVYGIWFDFKKLLHVALPSKPMNVLQKGKQTKKWV